MIPGALLLCLAMTGDIPSTTSTITFTLSSTTTEEGLLPVERVEIVGNRVIPKSIYRVLLRLPDRWPPTQASLDRASGQLAELLRKSGYVLARVEAKVDGERAAFYVDEGRLDRITFPGQVGLGALRLQLELNLPGDVFNQVELEAKLHHFQDQGLQIINYRLVRAATGGEVPLGDAPVALLGIPVLPEGGQFELQIFTKEVELPPGVNLEVDGRPADGLRVRVKYRWASLLLDDDRVEVGAEGGLRFQDFLGAPKERRKISRAALGAIYYSPRINGAPLRILAWPEVRWHSRQRLDLEIQSYDFLWVDPRLLFSINPSPQVQISFGGGLEYKRLLNVERIGTFALVEPLSVPQAFLELQLALALGGPVTRMDQQHRIELNARQILAPTETWRTAIQASWAKTIPFGFEELRLSLDAKGVFGRVAFTDEDRVGDALRGGLFGEQIYCDRVATAGVEFRWSLLREVYKVGVFHDGAVCHSSIDDKIKVADAFGIGLHALILDTFRFSLYVTQGFATGGLSDQGLAISLSQVF